MNMHRKTQRPKAFTLVELLVVMGIMGLLFAILMPAIGSVRQAANRNQSRQEMRGLESAILSFIAEYGRFPLQTVDTRDSDNDYGPRTELRQGSGTAAQIEGYTNLVHSLRGLLATDNPRGIVFLNITDRSISVGQYLDPWLNRYAVVADWNRDNRVSTSVHGFVSNRTVAIWSWGQGGYNDRAATARHLKSWTE